MGKSEEETFKMRCLIVLATLACGSLAMIDPFLDWARVHGKNYQTREEFTTRRAIFEKNYQDIQEHNAKFEAGEVTWSRIVNEYSDLTPQEFIKMRTGLPKYDNSSFLRDLVYINPVSTSIDATYLSDYNGGIYDDWRCCDANTDPNCIYNLNHAVTVIGYGTQGGVDYWLVKNSWGSWWGDNGFFKIKRGWGHCGVGRLHITSAYCGA